MASALAVTAIFVAWVATFAVGGPTRPVMMRKLWITLLIGSATFGGFSPDPKNPVMAPVACQAMNFLGPVYACLTARLEAHHAPAGGRGKASTAA